MLDKSVPYYGVLMVKEDMSEYPRHTLPPGYRFCHWREGLERDWARIEYSLGQTDSLEKAEEIFHREFLNDPALARTNCLFILDETGAAVGTASLWHGDHFGPKLSRIHWVAVDATHSGRGLAKALLTALCDLYHAQGTTGPLYLSTQTWSYPAIGIYRYFGFQPYLGPKPPNWKSENFDAENTQAWRIIEEKLSARRNTAVLP